MSELQCEPEVDGEDGELGGGKDTEQGGGGEGQPPGGGEEQEGGGRGEQEGEREKELVGEEPAAGGSGSGKKLSKRQRQVKENKEKKERYRAAAAAWGTGQFPTLRACAKSFGVDSAILHRGLLDTGGLFPGRGQFSTILKKTEEEMVANHVRQMATIGYGVTWEGLRLLLQELLLSLTAANPSRKTGLEEQGQLPSLPYVRRFAARNKLSLRKTSQISKGRAIISPADIQIWFADIGGFLDGRPDLLAALKDPRRVWNQDETACELGVGAQWVLAGKNTKQVFSVTSCTREHVTMSFTVSAAGEMVPPRAVFASKRNMAKDRLKELPKDGRTGEWQFSYSENGWVKAETFLDIIHDLGDYIKKHGIPTPVLWFIDGASCHTSLAMAKACIELGIQPLLLRPNTTHLTQALDLTFFSSLKAGFKRGRENWHRSNIGASLNKYTVIPLVQKAAENILENKPDLIGKGFQKAGIFPWNPASPNMERTGPSQVYAQESSTAVVPGQEMEVVEQGVQEEQKEMMVEEVQESAAINQLPLVTGQHEAVPAGASSQKTATVVPNAAGMPGNTARFLARFELLLSEEELGKFQLQFSSGNYTIENAPYQSWLVLKLATLPAAEVQAAEQVCTALHYTAIKCTSLH